MIHTQAEAKRYFVSRVVDQARAEGAPLSDAEHRMLSWSESDPDFVIDPSLPEQLASEISDKDYETKIGGLLARSFAADIDRAPEARGEWKGAFDALRQGDYYILIMVDAAVGRQLRTNTKWTVRHPLVRYIVTPLVGGTLAAVGMAGVMVINDLTGYRGSLPRGTPVSLGQAWANAVDDSDLLWLLFVVTVMVLGARAMVRRSPYHDAG